MNKGLLSDGRDRPDGYQEMIDFWSVIDTCGLSDAALSSELAEIRNAVTDCLYNGEDARAISLTVLAAMKVERLDDL